MTTILYVAIHQICYFVALDNMVILDRNTSLCSVNSNNGMQFNIIPAQ